ncbi:MAG: saccharopine dehydrogenase [Leptolyngbyaceae cyanobacterium SM1_1_3]|nr:saccharopine dehydrogenase [Leptolyngbyaceae cyanobacterium SM1_1_3]NJN03535.1 saccharopine dehydrogenase [Leptolyngbyaceae cyanobacterium RM1_1_2]NJO10652.1 saccharopine dehydrogenase [Leptolyngbyaceae cyanobacterium SL_1_1]
MTQTVLILGGTGRIGSSVGQDLLTFTQAAITLSGRAPQPQLALARQHPDRVQTLVVNLDNQVALREAIVAYDLIVHCAGPFRYRDSRVLQACIDLGKPYLDVADNPPYVREALSLRSQAEAAGVTAVVSTGLFPGISNSMVRQGIEQLDQADEVKLSYAVAGSGGAGVTVMRTTFLELQHSFPAWVDGQWQDIMPYSQRESVELPPPYGDCGVYWFSTVEAMTLPESFALQSVTTKFGSLPNFYNHLTWLMAHVAPKTWLRQPQTVEFLAQASHQMTQISDRFSGTGVAIRADILGQKAGRAAQYVSTLVHPDTAIAAGYGTGSVAQLILTGQLHQPGVWPVEQAVTTALFEQTMQQREVEINRSLS